MNSLPTYPAEYSSVYRDRQLLFVVLGAILLAAPCGLLVYLGRPVFAVALLLTLIGAVALLWRPVLGLYVVFAATLAVDAWDAGGFGLPSTQLHFWNPINSFTSIPLRAHPAEIVMAATLGALLLQRAHQRRAALVRGGPLLVPCLAFLVAVGVGLWRGLTFSDLIVTQEFDLGAAITEVRAFTYIPLMYLVAHTLVESRRQIQVLVGLLFAGVAFKILQGLWILAVLREGVFAQNEIFAHEDSLFLGSFLLLGLGLWMYRGPNKLRWLFVLLAPTILVLLVANQRRAGFVALAIGLVVAAALLVSDRQQRRRALAGSVVVAVLALVYGYAFWNAEGPLAQPAYAFRSIQDPDETKFWSNFFREIENSNLEHTIQRWPLAGVGFGQKYVMWVFQPSLDQTGFTYWRFIAHNATYWVWAKLGGIGFSLFWYMIGSAIVLGALLFRRSTDRLLKPLALFVVVHFVMQMIFSYADLGLTLGRTMAFLGIWMGVLASIDRMSPRPDGSPMGGRRQVRWIP